MPHWASKPTSFNKATPTSTRQHLLIVSLLCASHGGHFHSHHHTSHSSSHPINNTGYKRYQRKYKIFMTALIICIKEQGLFVVFIYIRDVMCVIVVNIKKELTLQYYLMASTDVLMHYLSRIERTQYCFISSLLKRHVVMYAVAQQIFHSSCPLSSSLTIFLSLLSL